VHLFTFLAGSYVYHYGTVPICRVPRAHGKGRFILGKMFAGLYNFKTIPPKILVMVGEQDLQNLL